MAKRTSKKSGDSKEQTKRKTAEKVQPNKSKSSNSTDKKATKPPQKSSSSSELAGVQVQKSTSALTQDLEHVRKRLRDLDAECREKVEEELKKNEDQIADQVEKVRLQAMNSMEKAVQELQEQFRAKLEAAHKELDEQQKAELAQITPGQDVSGQADAWREAMEKEIEEKKAETEADIERYRAKREADLDEQLKRLKEQCAKDVADYAERRRLNYTMLVEQLQQRTELELKNAAQKGKLEVSIKIDDVKARFVRAHSEVAERLNAQLAAAIADRRSKDSDVSQMLVEAKQARQAAMDKLKAGVEEQYKKERAQLVASIEQMESTIKASLAAEKRELERRTKKKAQLLMLLGMEDTRKLPDEELIFKRYKFKIERSQIVCQSSASIIYQASKQDAECLCKVTVFNKWSVRHRVDFHKHTTRLARYLTANHDKAPFFVKVLDIMATESKVYTFMEPLDSSRTLHAYLESLYAKLKKPASANIECKSGLKKAEMTNVLSQLIKAIAFLDNVFVAHSVITHANVTIAPSASNAEDLAAYKVVLHGLTRPIVYYNVESDELITVKGFDPTEDAALDPIDHLPPECFEPNFLASNLDVYSVGVLAYGMLRLRTPFAKQSQAKILACKQAEPVKLTLDKCEAEHAHLPSLIGALTEPNQRMRILVDDILKHAYFKQ